MRLLDPDAPPPGTMLELAEDQERLDRMAALACWYYKGLKGWDLPDILVEALVTSWHDSYLRRDDE